MGNGVAPKAIAKDIKEKEQAGTGALASRKVRADDGGQSAEAIRNGSSQGKQHGPTLLCSKKPGLGVPGAVPEMDEFDPDSKLLGSPFLRSRHEAKESKSTGSLARNEFPSAARQILLDLRDGRSTARPSRSRRASAPALHLSGLEHAHKAASGRRASESNVPDALDERLQELLRRAEGSKEAYQLQLPDHREQRGASAASAASSSLRWKEPDSVLIIVDWDDTLFPTTWLHEQEWFKAWLCTFKEEGKQDAAKMKPKIPAEDEALLDEFDSIARSFLLAACSLGHVSCVTLSRRPWQSQSMRALLPKLSSAWEQTSVAVRYAQEEKSVQMSVGLGTASPEDPVECALLRQVVHAQKKQKAMERELRKLYKQGSWKNVISIGDGKAERQALQEIGFKHSNPASPKTGEQKIFRIKTVKMLEDPSCSELLSELQMVQAWLPPLVSLDQDYDLALAAGEEALLDVHQQMMDLVEAADPSESSSPRSSEDGLEEGDGQDQDDSLWTSLLPLAGQT